MKPFFSYLRYRAAALLSLGVFGAVFALVYFLYDLPWGPAGYAALVGGTVLFLLALRDFSSYRGRCRALADELASLDAGAPALPAPANELEARYTELVEALDERRASLAFQADRRATEMQRYYTLWAHQIKTPLAAMGLTLQDMDAPLSAQLRGELQRVEQYVEMVLCYVRLDADSTDYLIRRCDLDAILRRELRAASALFIRGRIRLEFEETHARVLTDERWLGFVVGQILSNALKYTPPGGRVRISLDANEVLEIADSGAGIPPEDLPRVTERGFTGQNGHAQGRGTGLGLYLCRRVLERLGHGLEILSEPGEGTRVRIDLRAENVRHE